MKTLFAICISIFVLCMNKTYPFSPIQFILLEVFVIGLPSFFLALQPNTNPIKGKFLTNIAKTTLPAGLTLVASTIAMYIYQMFTDISPETMVTMASITIIVVGFIALYKICKPFNLFKTIMYLTCIGISIACVSCLYSLFKYTSLTFNEVLFVIVVCQASYTLHLVLSRIFASITTSRE